MRRLASPNPAFAGDRGEPDPAVRESLASADGPLGYLRAVVALCAARLLLPVVASGDDSMNGPDPGRHAELAAVSLRNEAGERALLAFTGLDSLRAWHADARPVPCTLDDLAATVIEAGDQVLLVDVAGPVSFVVGEDLIAHLAKGHRLVELAPGDFGWMISDAQKPL